MEENEMQEFSKALTEVNFILNHTDPVYVNKVPTGFRKFLNENEDKNYIPNIDLNIPLAKQHLQSDTRGIMALIYRSYFCNEEQKKEFSEMLQRNEQKYNKKMEEKYGYDKMFGANKEEAISYNKKNSSKASIALVDYSSMKWYKKISLKIKIWFNNFLNKNKYA